MVRFVLVFFTFTNLFSSIHCCFVGPPHPSPTFFPSYHPTVSPAPVAQIPHSPFISVSSAPVSSPFASPQASSSPITVPSSSLSAAPVSTFFSNKPVSSPSFSLHPTFHPTKPSILNLIFNANITLKAVSNAFDLSEKDIVAFRNATAISTHVDFSWVKFKGIKRILKRRMLRTVGSSDFLLSGLNSVAENAAVDLQAGSSEPLLIALLQIISPVSSSTNTTKLYQTLKTSLDQAIESGNFTTILRKVSIASGATAFQNANATSVTISSPTLTSATDSGSNSGDSDNGENGDSFPNWAIYAVSFGLFGVFAVAGLSVYCLFFRTEPSGGADNSYHYQMAASALPAPEILPLPTAVVVQPSRSQEQIEL
jgi:hypothetical protein